MSEIKTYIEMHKESGIKVGDEVKVLCGCPTRFGGWGNIWTKEMDKYIGEVFKVERDAQQRGFSLRGTGYRFPSFCLEKVEEKEEVRLPPIKPLPMEKPIPAPKPELEENKDYRDFVEEVGKIGGQEAMDYLLMNEEAFSALWRKGSNIGGLFIWGNSPQGSVFWHRIYREMVGAI